MNGSVAECTLKNPMSAGEVFVIETYFLFNDTSALLQSKQLEIVFSVRDGGTQLVFGEVTRVFGLDAVSEYGLRSRYIGG